MSKQSPLPIVVLISGNGSNLQAIIDAIHSGDITGEIKAVISNRAGVYGLERAQRHGIPVEVIDHTQFDSREKFDAELMQRIEVYKPELVVLAGFMRILTDNFIRHFEGRMLNIHPSLLPNFRGLNTHQRALDAGVDYHGCSVHFVTSKLDGGPVIIQSKISVLDNDDVESLTTRVVHQEHIIYPLAVSWYCTGRIKMNNNQVYMDNKPLMQAIMADELPIKVTAK